MENLCDSEGIFVGLFLGCLLLAILIRIDWVFGRKKALQLRLCSVMVLRCLNRIRMKKVQKVPEFNNIDHI